MPDGNENNNTSPAAVLQTELNARCIHGLANGARSVIVVGSVVVVDCVVVVVGSVVVVDSVVVVVVVGSVVVPDAVVLAVVTSLLAVPGRNNL